jgi:hypothetical protein
MTQDLAERFVAQLLYAATTESLIPWDWLEKSRAAVPRMTEWERVTLLLNAVNGERISVEEWERLCGAPLTLPLAAGDAVRNELLQRPLPLHETARNSLRAALEAILREPETVVDDIGKNSAAIMLGHVLTVPELSKHGAREDLVIAHSIGAALIYTLRLVLDPERPYRKRLKQCGLKECGCLGLAKPPSERGQPQKYYCSSQHRSEHRKAQARDWTAAARIGRDVGDYRARIARKSRREIPMNASTAAEHFIDIIRCTVPSNADIHRADQGGDLRLIVDWRLDTDLERPNKRSKSIGISISREAVEDYVESSRRRQEAADARLTQYLETRLEQFDPEHSTPREVTPPREWWLVSTGMINP